MSERQKHTEFLKHCLRYDDNTERHDLHDKLSRIQHEMRVVKRSVWVLALVVALALGSWICEPILLQDASPKTHQLIFKLLCALIAGALISIAAFVGLWLSFRRKLHRWREESRELVKRMLATKLGEAGEPPATPAPPRKPRLPRG
jgi:di/tricarboxylate transporter